MDAVIFDMDGVLVDSELHWRPAETQLLRALVPAWSDGVVEGIEALDWETLRTASAATG